MTQDTTTTSGAADLPEALRRSTAADGKTELFNLPGYPLMVRAVDFNRIHAESEMRRAALLDEMQKAALAAGQAVAPVEKWADRVQRAHPKSEPEFWPDELRMKYMAEEIRDLRATRPAPHAMDGGEDAEELRLLCALAFSVERAIGNGVMPLDIEEAYEGYNKWSAARAAQQGASHDR